MEEFDKNDWAHFHDVILDSIGRHLEQFELETVYESLPDDFKESAVKWV